MNDRYNAVLEAIGEIERRYKDTSGGYDLPYQVAKWMRQLSATDREKAIETLFSQFENATHYGYMLPDIIRLLPAPEHLERFLRVSLTLPHIGVRDYHDLLSSVFGFGPEYNQQMVTIARKLVRSLLDESEVAGAVLLGGLIRLGIPGAAEDAAAYLEEWSTRPGKEAFLDTFLLQFSDFFPQESVVSMFGAVQRLQDANSKHAFIITAMNRVRTNPLLKISCKWLLTQLEKCRVS